jgi:putative ABC transport system substrate-binding protein
LTIRVWLLVVLIIAVLASLHDAEAQPPTRPWRIGWLHQGSRPPNIVQEDAFRAGMRALGYTEGHHYVLELRYAEGRPERHSPLAAQLVALPVDVILGLSTPTAIAASRATSTIPIVIVLVADPVGSGLARSLARPGGNVTGTALALDEVSQKWLELLRTVRPRLSRVAVLSNPSNQSMSVMLTPLESSAQALDVKLSVHDLSQTERVDSVLNAVTAGRPDALIVLPDAFLFDHRARIADTAARLRLPDMYGTRRWLDAGGLMSYGPQFIDNFRRAATYVDKILKGARPGDLPIERPTKYELVVSRKAAEARGLTLPQSVLQRADDVIQ